MFRIFLLHTMSLTAIIYIMGAIITVGG